MGDSISPRRHIFARRAAGFTLIELLVVIAIISLLAAIVMVSVNGARTKAKIAKVNADLLQLQKVMEIARNNNNSILQGVTGTYWTAGTGGCNNYPGNRDMRYLPASDPCLQYLNAQWQKLGLPKAPIDPWGSPYTFDENEMESGQCSTTYRDSLASVGPDGIYGNSDDYAVNVNFYLCAN